MGKMRTEDIRSERRIIRNRIRRQYELKKNFFLFAMTLCLVIIFSVSINGFRSNAKNHSTELSQKYYKSIIVLKEDTLWSIAERYMDQEYYVSINDYIAEVQNMNSLPDDDIHYGEYLIIPYYDRLNLTQTVE